MKGVDVHAIGEPIEETGEFYSKRRRTAKQSRIDRNNSSVEDWAGSGVLVCHN